MNTVTHTTLKHLSAREFAALGLDYVAYIKPKVTAGEEAYAIHAADGTEVTVVGSYELAVATIRQHDMEPAQLQ